MTALTCFSWFSKTLFHCSCFSRSFSASSASFIRIDSDCWVARKRANFRAVSESDSVAAAINEANYCISLDPKSQRKYRFADHGDSVPASGSKGRLLLWPN